MSYYNDKASGVVVCSVCLSEHHYLLHGKWPVPHRTLMQWSPGAKIATRHRQMARYSPNVHVILPLLADNWSELRTSCVLCC